MGVSCNGPAIDSSLPGGHLKLTFRSHKDPTKIPLKVNGSHNGKRFTGLPFKASPLHPPGMRSEGCCYKY